MMLKKTVAKKFSTVMVLACCLLCLPMQVWAVACNLVFSNGIQATGASGNVSLKYHSILTGGSATLATKTLTDNTSWVACSGSSCVASGTAATTSSVAFVTGSGANGAISVTSGNSPLSKASGDYTTVNVAQQTTLTFSTASGTYKTTAFTTNFQSIVQLQSGDYWINGNLTLGQETVLKRIASSGTTRIFVNGNVTMAYKVTTQSFASDQLLIYATGTITIDNEANLSAYIYAGGNVSLDYKSVINGGVSGSNFIGADNEVTVNYQPSAFTTANFAPFCSGALTPPVLLGSWHMDETSWNGTAAEVKDTSGSGNHGKASIAVAGNSRPSTTSGSSAYTTGLQSTCRYGAFDGTGSPTRTYDYVELSGFPTLPNGFTFAAWIRSTNAGAQHQRILVRDDAQNGWGLSLADGTGQPKLRFFARNITNNGAVTGQGSDPGCGVFCVDTNAVLTSNAWYYVASVIDTTAKTITLYVYNASGVLQAKTSGAYSGTWTDGTGIAAIGGETSASGEGTQTSWHFLGNIDEVNIYSGALSQISIESLLTTVRTCPAPDHYELDMSATSLTCLGSDVTVRACVDSVSPCTNIDYTINTNVSLAASAGTLNATTLNLASGTGTTKLLYPAAADGSTANVTLSGEATAATNARKCCVGGSCSVANFCTTTFKTAGFIFPTTTTGITNNISTATSGIDGTAYLRALQTNTTTGACMARFSAPQTVKMAYKCVNPTSCITGEILTLNNTAVPGNSNIASPVVYGDVNLSFDTNGSAPIPINYSDVGQVQLFASLALSAASGEPAYTLTGSSNLFVVKPYDIKITSVQTSAGSNNPGTTTTGAGFVASGTAFKVSAQAFSYYTAATVTPHVTPNYGLETSPSPETVGLQINGIVNPSGGNIGALTNPNAFSKMGLVFNNTTVSWNEVGTVALKAHIGDGDYLGAGDVTSLTAVNVGRFYPDHFRKVSATATSGCATFTYMEQPNISVSYNFQAENLNNSVVTNYGAGYSSTLAVPVYAVENMDNAIDFGSRFTIATSPTWVLGVMNFSATTGKFSRLITAAKVVPDGPFESSALSVKLSDTLDSRTIRSADLDTSPSTSGSCGASCTAVNLGSAFKFRFGRLRLDDAFGPETFPLTVNFATEYWVGNHFSVNTDDSCTLVPRSTITYPAGNISVDANRTVSLTGGTTTGIYGIGNINLSATDVAIRLGTAGQTFTSPAGGKGRFIVGVNLTTMPWLRFDWNQDGDYSDLLLPNANFEFGSYRGNDRIIYWREKLQ